MAITASEARRALVPLIEKVNDDRVTIEIASKRGNAVLMSVDEYAAWQETAYLFRSPANARRLLDAAETAARGEFVEHPQGNVGRRRRDFNGQRRQRCYEDGRSK